MPAIGGEHVLEDQREDSGGLTRLGKGRDTWLQPNQLAAAEYSGRAVSDSKYSGRTTERIPVPLERRVRFAPGEVEVSQNLAKKPVLRLGRLAARPSPSCIHIFSKASC